MLITPAVPGPIVAVMRAGKPYVSGPGLDHREAVDLPDARAAGSGRGWCPSRTSSRNVARQVGAAPAAPDRLRARRRAVHARHAGLAGQERRLAGDVAEPPEPRGELAARGRRCGRRARSARPRRGGRRAAGARPGRCARDHARVVPPAELVGAVDGRVEVGEHLEEMGEVGIVSHRAGSTTSVSPIRTTLTLMSIGSGLSVRAGPRYPPNSGGTISSFPVRSVRMSTFQAPGSVSTSRASRIR